MSRRIFASLAVCKIGLLTALPLIPQSPIQEPTPNTQHLMASSPATPGVPEAGEIRAVKATPTPTPTPIPTPQPTVAPTPLPAPQTSYKEILNNSKHDWMRAAGIPEGDWQYVDFIISKESGWRHTIWNTTGSGAYGLCQSLPASKMASAGADYMTNPITQLRWCHSYAQHRYGGWYNAYQFWLSNAWW